MNLVHAQVDSPVGLLALVASETGLRAVMWPGDDPRRVARALREGDSGRPVPQGHTATAGHSVTAGHAATDRGAPASTDVGVGCGAAGDHLHLATVELAEYFAGQRRTFSVPLDLRGTPFQLAAWAVLRAIPFGARISYSEQARRLGDARKSRAVGAANGANPVSIIVGCHRVVAAGGGLTGFAGGLAAKSWLLAHEARGLSAPQGSQPSSGQGVPALELGVSCEPTGPVSPSLDAFVR